MLAMKDGFFNGKKVVDFFSFLYGDSQQNKSDINNCG